MPDVEKQKRSRKMTKAYKTKLAEFIANYVNILDGKHSFREEKIIRQSIALILKKTTMETQGSRVEQR